jgi:hypothetical protein
MNHYFDIDVASKYNVNIAIFLNNLAHWTTVNIANRKNYYDFRYWTYNSRRAFLELFPYWTDDQLRTIITNAIKADLVIEGCYNSKGYDRTKWYSLSDKALALYKINPISPTDQELFKNTPIELPKSSPASFGRNPNWTWEKSPMDLGEIPNACGENPQPIPYSIPDDKPDTTTTNAQILNNFSHSEPVVVSSTSLTSNPNVNPQNPVNADRPGTTDKLLAAYRAKPIMRGNIMCEGDFLSAAYFSIDNRDKLTTTEQQRINGICGLIRRGEFDEPPEWSLNLKRLRDRESGLANATLQEHESAKKAVLDPNIKGRDDALARIKQMNIGFKEATEKKLCYPDKVTDINSAPKKQFKKIELPSISQEIFFQPDMSLIKTEQELDKEIDDIWEVRL